MDYGKGSLALASEKRGCLVEMMKLFIVNLRGGAFHVAYYYLSASHTDFDFFVCLLDLSVFTIGFLEKKKITCKLLLKKG